MQQKYILYSVSFGFVVCTMITVLWQYFYLSQDNQDLGGVSFKKHIQQGDLVSLNISIFDNNDRFIGHEETKTILLGSHYLPDTVEKALIGASIGDTREIISSGTLQGSGRVMLAIKNEQILPEYDMVVPAKNYFGSVFLDRPWADYPGTQVNDEVQVSGYGTGIVIDILRGMVQIEVPNIYSPFYGQKLQIGASGDQGNRRLTVKEIQGDTMALNIQNTDSPLLGKQVEPGLEWMQDGNMMRIEQMFNDYVLVSFDNTKEPKKYRIAVKNIE